MKTRKCLLRTLPAPAIHLGRACTFFVARPSSSWFFYVELTCFKAVDAQTGMSVDLTVLDAAIKQIFKSATCKNEAPIKFLNKKVLELKRKLRGYKTQLMSVKFTEIRSFGVNFRLTKNITAEIFRQDFAIAANQDLYKIISFFNHAEQLTKIQLHNLKSNVSEEIIF